MLTRRFLIGNIAIAPLPRNYSCDMPTAQKLIDRWDIKLKEAQTIETRSAITTKFYDYLLRSDDRQKIKILRVRLREFKDTFENEDDVLSSSIWKDMNDDFSNISLLYHCDDM